MIFFLECTLLVSFSFLQWHGSRSPTFFSYFSVVAKHLHGLLCLSLYPIVEHLSWRWSGQSMCSQNLRKWNVSNKQTQKITTSGIWKPKSVKLKMCEESKFVKVDSKSVKSGLNHFKPPATRKCEATHRGVIKKVEVNFDVKTKEGAVAKQVVRKALGEQ